MISLPGPRACVQRGGLWIAVLADRRDPRMRPSPWVKDEAYGVGERAEARSKAGSRSECQVVPKDHPSAGNE